MVEASRDLPLKLSSPPHPPPIPPPSRRPRPCMVLAAGVGTVHRTKQPWGGWRGCHRIKRASSHYVAVVVSAITIAAATLVM